MTAEAGGTLELLVSWSFVADGVMGGVSSGQARTDIVDGRKATRLTGTVSLENNGGFIQIAADMTEDRGAIDARAWTGIELDLTGNGEAYNVHLRTADVTRPWQSYRQSFMAPPSWTSLRFDFTDFTPHRIATPLDLARLRRIGIVAIGRVFEADVAVAGMRFYR